MFGAIRSSITRNIRDIKIWVESISNGLEHDDERAISYGLFFVYIYGVYEEIIRRIIVETISELNASSVKLDQCIISLYSLLLSPEYDSLYHVGNDNKWEKRWSISEKIENNPEIHIDLSLFPTDGRNLRYEQLCSLKKSFGIQEDPLPRIEIRGYIQEMVDNRNFIAHGDKLPKEVGRLLTKQDLLDRCNYISEVCNYMCDIYERYIREQQYIRA